MEEIPLGSYQLPPVSHGLVRRHLTGMQGLASCLSLHTPHGTSQEELAHAKEKEAVNLLMLLRDERPFSPDRGAHASWKYMNDLPPMHPTEPPYNRKRWPTASTAPGYDYV